MCVLFGSKLAELKMYELKGRAGIRYSKCYNGINVLDSWCNASEEEDAAAETSTSCAELGCNETKPSHGHSILRDWRWKTLQRTFLCTLLYYCVFICPLLGYWHQRAALPVAQPTLSKHRREKYHIPWTCLPQAHLGVLQLCLWPLIAPGYLWGALPCLSSALWSQCPIFCSQWPRITSSTGV